ITDAEGDRDRRGRSFGRKRRRIAGRNDNGHATADEVCHERWQSIVLAAKPVVLDHHVLVLDVAGFAESFSERDRRACGVIERPTADKAHHRHCRLLCMRRERPSCCRTSNHFDKLAPSHELPLDEAYNLAHYWTVKGAVRRSEIFPLMSAQ